MEISTTATSSASPGRKMGELLKMTMVTGLLLMDNGDAYDQHATCFLGRCTSSSWYYGKYARVVTNVECRRLPAQHPGSCCMRQVYSYIFWFGFSNGEWRRYSWISAHAAGDASGSSHVLSACLGDNVPMEAMEDEENIHIKLSTRV